MAKRTSLQSLSIDFITLHDEEPDLIVSFVVTGSMGSASVTLTRTPKYEIFEDASERGLRVYRDSDADPASIVSRITVYDRSISIEGSNSAYELKPSSTYTT